MQLPPCPRPEPEPQSLCVFPELLMTALLIVLQIARHPFALRVERDCLRDSSAPHDTRTRVIAPQRSLDFRPSHTFDSDSSVDEKHGADADEEDSEHRFNDDNDDAIFPYARDYPPVEPRPVINGPFASLIGTLEGILDDSHNAAESLEQSDLSSDEDNVYQHRRLANFRMPSVLELSEQPTPMPSSSTGASTPRAVPTPRSFGRRKSTAIQPPELDISGWSLVPSPGSEEASLLSWPAAAVLPSGYDASPTTPMFAYSVPLESTSASRRRTNSVSSTRSGKSSRLSAVFNRLRPGSAPAPSLASPIHLSPTD